MALTLRLSEKETKVLNDIKKALGKPNMTSSSAIIMLITIFERREEAIKKLEERVRELEKKEKILESVCSAFNEVIKYKQKNE